jgi:glutamate-1-semialdehyde 2,1-aminomutase
MAHSATGTRRPLSPQIWETVVKATTIESLTAQYRAELAERTPGSHELREEAEQVLAGGVSSHFKAWQPFYVREAKGAHLTDVDGNDYVDLIMGFGPNSLGHSPEVVVGAVRDAIAHGTSLAIATPLEVELAQSISRLVPSMEVMRFVVTGTEATMMALRAARAFTGRSRIARFEGHYHGQHDSALVSVAHVAGSEDRPRAVADGAGITRGVLDDVVVLPWNDIDVVAPVVRAVADDLAAIILEPVPFSNLGGEEPDPEFLRALRELTWERGVLLVFDEVITGFRLGIGGAAAHFGFAPDLHCFGKAVGGGFPIGVFGGRRDVMDAVVRTKLGDPHAAETIFQSGTFSGAPPSMAAGLAMLHALEHTDAIAVADARAEAIRAGWRQIVGELGLAAQVTGTSSWLGISFTDRPIRTRRDAITADGARAQAFSLGLLLGGVYLAPSHPGFTSAAHTEEDVRHVLDVSAEVLARIAATTEGGADR